MGRGGWALRFLFGAVVIFGIIWLLFAGILVNHATTTTSTSYTVPSTEIFNNWKLIAREKKKQKHHAHQDMDLNYVSKRRVPNGPDPIHNRRASKYRQPPGRI